VTIAIDELVGIDELERAAVEFARTAPAVLIGDGVNALVAELLDEVCGLSGLPIDDEAQIVAPFACPGCGSMQGFRRRGSQVRERKLTSLVGEVALVSRMVHCRSCDRRFSPLGQLLGLAPRQRRTEGLAKATARLAVEVAYAKASRFLSELAGVEVSARTVRRDLTAAAPQAITPRGEITSVPVMLFDGTGERAGPSKGGVALNLAIGIVWRKTMSGRRTCGVELLAATLGESWPAMFEAVSMDLGPAYLKSVTAQGHAPQAIICADIFHLVKLVSGALDEVRRDLWQQLRRLPDGRWAKDFKGSRWALLKNPEDLTDTQAEQLARIRRTRGGIWRAYEMNNSGRSSLGTSTVTRPGCCSTVGVAERPGRDSPRSSKPPPRSVNAATSS
jgi:hypothetical protein